jgi:hypothetical protein
MPDVLVRDVPADDLARVDRAANRAGVSRAEYLRRLIAGQVEPPAGRATMAQLERFGAAIAGVADADLMARAWR